MTQQTSKTLILAMTLATFSFLAIPSAAFAMGSINLELQKTAGADRLEEDARNARGEETFINLSALNITELDVTETAAFKGSIYPNPGQVNVDFSIVNPDGTHLESVVLQTNTNGEFKYQFTAMDAGNYAITASWDGNHTYLGTSAELELPVNETTGMFIVLTSGSFYSNTGHARAEVARFAVNSLVTRGIPTSRIQYLTPDYATSQQPAFATGHANTENLVHAIQEWAPNMVDTRTNLSGKKTPLTVILIGHGFQDVIYTQDNDIITSQELDAALDTFGINAMSRFAEASVTPLHPNMVPVNIVLEANKSGSFIDELTGANRFIFASTDYAQDPNGYSNLDSNGQLSFTYQFMAQLASNQTLAQAFTGASSILNSYYTNQVPMLSADFDATPNESSDQLAVSGIYLQNHASSNLAPTIISINAATDTTTSSAPLLAMVTDPEGDNLNVSATIVPPAGSNVSTFVQALVQSGSGNTYSAEATGLNAPGVYQVIYSAIDSNGNISNVKSTTITVE